VKKLHERVKAQIKKKNESFARQANKGHKKVVFQSGDWVWVHMRNERFSEQRKSKLQPRGDGPFYVLERINENAYKNELPGEYNVSTTFNVSDLTLFDVNEEADLRTNPFEEGETDEDMAMTKGKEPLEGLGGPMPRARTKKAKEALQQVLSMLFEFRPKLQVEKLQIVNCTMFQEKYRVPPLLSGFISILLVEIKAQTCVKVVVNSLWIFTTYGLVLI